MSAKLEQRPQGLERWRRGAFTQSQPRVDPAACSVTHHLLIFDDPEETLEAVHTLQDSGFDVADVVSPFPVHGIEEALGEEETRLPWATLVGGILGLSIAVGFQLWTHAVDWPLNVGGKSVTAIPAIIPVSFELTVLFAAFGTFFGILWRERLRPMAEPRGIGDLAERGVTCSKFAVIVRADSGAFDEKRFYELCDELEPTELEMSWRWS